MADAAKGTKVLNTRLRRTAVLAARIVNGEGVTSPEDFQLQKTILDMGRLGLLRS